MNALVTTNADAYRASTDAANLCKQIVVASAQNIQGRKYIKVEGWQAIAIAHGCTASADHVERVEDDGLSGFRALGIVRRMSDGAEISRAEGFLGDDEPTWTKRPVYARRAMVQTRAISRACRSAFAHVVVMMNAGLETTPAEEVPMGGFDNGQVIEHAPRVNANGVKRLSSARAKEIGLHTEINDKIDGCKTLAACDAFDDRFDVITQEAPLSWLDAIRNRMILHRETLAAPEPAIYVGAEGERFDARGNPVADDDHIPDFPGDFPAKGGSAAEKAAPVPA